MIIGDYIKLYDNDNNFYIISPEYESTIDSAVSRWIDSGKTLDTLLDIELAEKAPFRILASVIVAWIITTPESRRRYIDFVNEVDKEEKAVKMELGIFEED